jgi:hypothetical protein
MQNFSTCYTSKLETLKLATPPGTGVIYMQGAHDVLAYLLKNRGFQQRSGRHLVHLSADVGVSATSLLKKASACPWTNLQYLSWLEVNSIC